MFNIVDYIPTGHQNAISRRGLRILTGLPDREIRRCIHEARRETVILNVQNGHGYFIPDPDDKTDCEALRKFVKQEENRLRSIGWALKMARRMLRGIEEKKAA